MIAARAMNFAPAVGAVVQKPGPIYGYIGALLGHWRLAEYARRSEWWCNCVGCGHRQLVRVVGDDYLSRCRSCLRSSSFERPSLRAKYLRPQR